MCNRQANLPIILTIVHFAWNYSSKNLLSVWSVECPLESSLRVEHYFLDDRYETDLSLIAVVLALSFDIKHIAVFKCTHPVVSRPATRVTKSCVHIWPVRRAVALGDPSDSPALKTPAIATQAAAKCTIAAWTGLVAKASPVVRPVGRTASGRNGSYSATVGERLRPPAYWACRKRWPAICLDEDFLYCYRMRMQSKSHMQSFLQPIFRFRPNELLMLVFL